MAGNTSNPPTSGRFSFHKNKRDDWHGQVVMHCLGDDYAPWLDSHSIFTFAHRSKRKSLWKLATKIVTLGGRSDIIKNVKAKVQERKASPWSAETHFCRQAAGRWLHSFYHNIQKRLTIHLVPGTWLDPIFQPLLELRSGYITFCLSERKVEEMPLISEPELEREGICLFCAVTFSSLLAEDTWQQGPWVVTLCLTRTSSID